MKRMRSVKKVDVFMCFAGGFQSVGAKTLNESSSFQNMLEPQDKFERCMCEKVGNKSLVIVWMTYLILVLFIENRKCARGVDQRHIFRQP